MREREFSYSLFSYISESLCPFLITVSLCQLPKMIAEGREHQAFLDLVAVAGNDPSHETPEIAARLVADPQRIDDTRKGGDVFTFYLIVTDLRRAFTQYSTQAVEGAIVILTRAVAVYEDRLVTFNQLICVHFRHNVEHAIRIADAMLWYALQTALAFESTAKLCIGDRSQQSDHGNR